jgi:hypothetical protein
MPPTLPEFWDKLNHAAGIGRAKNPEGFWSQVKAAPVEMRRQGYRCVSVDLTGKVT